VLRRAGIDGWKVGALVHPILFNAPLRDTRLQQLPQRVQIPPLGGGGEHATLPARMGARRGNGTQLLHVLANVGGVQFLKQNFVPLLLEEPRGVGQPRSLLV
jgi:hypothetical protein